MGHERKSQQEDERMSQIASLLFGAWLSNGARIGAMIGPS